ncbi:hypothetical protein [Helicobacter bizzozeronii]|uniref:hypothetical protein n=1 Tax=Helicobacter bizzozeronii TaxID=56877 RepID=UPI000CF14170|nr:hypothetical protein [Helicobacter bizzozeronii]
MQDKKWHNNPSGAPLTGAFHQYNGWLKTTITAKIMNNLMVCSFLKERPALPFTLKLKTCTPNEPKVAHHSAVPYYTLKFPPCNKTS